MKWRYGWGVVLGMVLTAIAGAGMAQDLEAMRKQVEISLLVHGEITVDERGTMAEYTLDEQDKLPKQAVAFIRESLERLAFKPPQLDGEPVKLRNRMSLLVVAKEAEADRYLLRLQAASFFPEASEAGYDISAGKLKPPAYPETAAYFGVQGTVYLVLKVGRDGRVQDAMAEQVNLRVVDTPKMMARLRKEFADASIKAARRWKFNPPTRGEEADAEFWTVRVPTDFSMAGEDVAYGRWVAYVPGPRTKAAWVAPELVGDSPEAMAAGVPRPLDKDGLQLLVPLGDGGS